MAYYKRLTAGAMALGVSAAALVAQPAEEFSDNYDSGDDSAYSHYDPISAVTGIPWGSWTLGNGAYTLSADASPNPAALGPARLASFRNGFGSGDFNASVDLVDWDGAQAAIYGIAGRVNSPGLGSTAGYLFGYDNSTRMLTIRRIANEALVEAIAEISFALDPAKDYRLVASAVGSTFSLTAYDTAEPASPLAFITGSDATLATGAIGLAILNNSFEAGGTAMAAFDNFNAVAVVVPEPGTLALLGVLGAGLALASRRRQK